MKPAYITGLTYKMDDNHFNRMKAIEYTIEHDNGQNLILLLKLIDYTGHAEDFKTPLAMMANLGTG